MDLHDDRLPSRKKGLLGWLGLATPVDETPAPSHDAAAPPPDPQALQRTEAIGALGEFLTLNRLPVTAFTLAIGYDCISGVDPRLAAAIISRRLSGEGVTIDWLEEMRRGASLDDEAKLMSQLMERLETNIDAFTRTTNEARSATSEYHTTLKAQVEELHEVKHVGSVMEEMVAIARTMIDRTREIEQQMARSEEETRALQTSLEEARHNAEVDHLTGLPNRRTFENRLDREVREAALVGDPLCVAFCDIDRFKKINDTHGHDAGDRVLRAVARALAEISDERCHVARHGGEEFVVLLRGKTLDQAYEVLDAARENLAERRMVNRANDMPFGKVTFSAGIAALSEYPDPRAALKAADEALYVAKDEGRNRIVRAPARSNVARETRAA